MNYEMIRVLRSDLSYYVGLLYMAFLWLCGCQSQGSSPASTQDTPLSYEIILDTLLQGYTDSTSWFYPSVGVVHPEGWLVMTIQKWLTGKSDVFTPVVSGFSFDNGKSWSALEDPSDAFAFIPGEDGFETGMCNFTIKWHQKTETLLGTCHSVPYQNKKLIRGDRLPVWATFDAQTKTWNRWQPLFLPEEPQFYETNACADQRVDLPDGDILLPIYYRGKDEEPFTTSVARCNFDGKSLQFKELGNELSIPVDRGLFEPSLTRYGDTFYLTMRNDQKGYWAVSTDGLKFSEPQVWHFDNGEEVGTYNTMQHWLTHSSGLFLVYTRKGADNDHVIRHRAPLFIAEVDTSTMQLIKASERIAVPNRGARLGNFSVSHINEDESWITVAELMVGQGEEQYGANGNVFASRLRWNIPNALWKE